MNLNSFEFLFRNILSLKPEFLPEMEKAMSLLAFDVNSDSPIKDLLDHSQRQKTASELNAAILTAQSQEKGKSQLNIFH